MPEIRLACLVTGALILYFFACLCGAVCAPCQVESTELFESTNRIPILTRPFPCSISSLHRLLVKCNRLAVDIDNEIVIVHNFIRDKYRLKFPELESLVGQIMLYTCSHAAHMSFPSSCVCVVWPKRAQNWVTRHAFSFIKARCLGSISISIAVSCS
jgi:hypothetical protein